MDKNSLIRERKKLETKQEKLKNAIDKMQLEFNYLNETLKRTNVLIAQIEKAEDDATSLFGKIKNE